MNMAICCICGKNTGLLKVMIKNHKYVCYDCVKKAGHNPMVWMGNLNTSEDDLKNQINKSPDSINPNDANKQISQVSDLIADENGNDNQINSIEQFDIFNAKLVKQVNADILVGKEFFADSTKRMFYVTVDPLRMKYSPLFSFDDILSFELLEDGTPVNRGGLGSAIAGGFIAGPVGAVVGASVGSKKTNYKCTSLKIKITINNLDNPVVYVDCLGMFKSYKDTSYYKKAYEEAQKIISILQIMTNDNKQSEVSPANEMAKYKQLVENGVITNEEYNGIKKKLIQKI